ncbi:MAG: DMT family transporter [Pseudomonadota bacterium]
MPDWGSAIAPQVARVRRAGGGLLPAAGVLLLGILLLDGMAAFVKVLGVRYGALELSAWRNMIGMVPAVVALAFMGELSAGPRGLMIRQWRLAFGRGIMVGAAQLCYYLALMRSEFAMVAALGYTMSLFVVAFSVPVLGERVGIWRWTAVFLGFAGALVIVRPGAEDFNAWSVLPLVAASCYALSMVTVRLIDTSVSNALMYLYSSFSSAVMSILMVLPTGGFSPIGSAADALSIVAMGLLGGLGVLCLLISVRMAEPSKLAPFN